MSHTKEVDQNIRNGKSSGITYSILAEAEYVCHCAVLSSVCLWQDPLYDYWLFVQLNKSYDTRSWVNDRFKYYPPLTLLENWFAAKMVLSLLSLGFLLSVFRSLKLTTDVFICAYLCVAIKSSMPDVAIPLMPITDFVFQDMKKFGDRPALVSTFVHVISKR